MEDPQPLIKRAFGQARASGKPDWYRMTTAVLKNRLLSLTERAFDEADYEAGSFTSFIRKHNDIVSVDDSVFPPIVELLTQESEVLEARDISPTSTRPRVRSDLWTAVTDYTSDTKYVWDTDDRRARPWQISDEGPIIPGISRSEHQQWREEFIEAIKASIDITSEEESQTRVWVQQRRPTSKLPPALISKWNAFVRDEVHDYLLNWFEKSGLEAPSDLMMTSTVRATRKASDSEALRKLVNRVVSEMTEHELAQLELPARAVLRVTTIRRP